MKFVFVSVVSTAILLSGCATTEIQPMSKDTFKIATDTSSDCGSSGARSVAFKAAAIEVIRRGGDKFILLADTTDASLQGDFFSGFDTGYSQGMVVKMVSDGSSEAGNALSARGQLGAGWQEIVAKGVPETCT